MGVVLWLDDDHAAALATTKLVEVRPEGGGCWRLLPAGRVGAVRIGDLEVRVQPKTGIARLLFLLGYAADPGFRPEDVAGVREPDLWPALAESLARHVERALGPGVLQGYVTIDESLSAGTRADPGRRPDGPAPGLPLPLEVRYDEYAPDIPENRLIRSALRRMLAVPGLRRRVQRPAGPPRWSAGRRADTAPRHRPACVAAHPAQCPLRGGAAAGADRAAEPVCRARPWRC